MIFKNAWLGIAATQSGEKRPKTSAQKGNIICLSKFSTGNGCIEDIYLFEVNTKYTAPNVFKVSLISRVRSTSEIADIFNT